MVLEQDSNEQISVFANQFNNYFANVASDLITQRKTAQIQTFSLLHHLT